MEPVKVVVRCLDGKLFKGYTNDFLPNKPSFHVQPVETGRAEKVIEVVVNQLKAVFFVKDFAGDPSYHDRKHAAESEQPVGRKVEVTFMDGEVLVGFTMTYDPKRPGFFSPPQIHILII